MAGVFKQFGKMKAPKGCITIIAHCLFKCRKKEEGYLFSIYKDKTIIRLIDYAIIPLEEYLKISKTKIVKHKRVHKRSK